MTISLKDVQEEQERIYEKATSLVAKKGADYNREQQIGGDTLYNLRVSSILGIVTTPQQGVLVRLADKLMRLISLADAGQEEANKDESVDDTIADIWNYTSYYSLFRKEQKKQIQERRDKLDSDLIKAVLIDSATRARSFSPQISTNISNGLFLTPADRHSLRVQEIFEQFEKWKADLKQKTQNANPNVSNETCVQSNTDDFGSIKMKRKTPK